MCYGEGRGIVPLPEFVPQGRYPEFRVRTWEFTPQTEPYRTQWFYLAIYPAIYLANLVNILYTYILAGHKVTWFTTAEHNHDVHQDNRFCPENRAVLRTKCIWHYNSIRKRFSTDKSLNSNLSGKHGGFPDKSGNSRHCQCSDKGLIPICRKCT